MTRYLVFLTACGLLATTVAIAQDKPLKLGDPAPDWKGLKGTDDKEHALADFQDKEALVVVFTCNSCPYSQDYEDRLVAFVKDHCGEGKKAALIAINANKVKEDLPDEMKKRAQEKGFNFPYVWDETQQTARAYDAKWTPEFYVFDKERKLVYRGKMDDNTDPKLAKINYLADAVRATLAGKQPEVAETDPVGCAVRYERRRRTRQ